MHYIIYHDKSIEWVEDKTAKIIWDESCAGNKGIEINGRKYIFSSISKILPEEEFFRQYPGQAPPEEKTWTEPKDEYTSMENLAKKSKENFKGLLKGLKQFIDEEKEKGETPKQTVQIFNEKVEQYKKIYN